MLSMPGIHLPLSATESILIGLAVTAVVMVPLLWEPAGHLSAMTHHGAHVLIAFILGVTVTDVVLDRHSEGRTGIAGDGLRAVLVVLIGYLGPSLFGLGAARLISLGYPVAVLWLLVLLLLLVLFMLGRSFGWLTVPIAIGLLYVILRYTHAGTETVIAYALAWLLLLAGLRIAIGHAAGAASVDAAAMRRRTHVPGRLWTLIWLAGTVGALLVGGKLLVLG
jgi:Peptidase M50B-like